MCNYAGIIHSDGSWQYTNTSGNPDDADPTEELPISNLGDRAHWIVRPAK
jgi:hypothetical protein